MGNPEIKNRFDGSIIIPAGKYPSLKEAVEKEYKNLSSANLRSADLSSANLRSADLRSANLSYADLSSANLRSANLSLGKYKEPLFLPDLYCLKLLPKETTLTFWKYLKNGKSPYQKCEYEVGKIYKFNDADKNEQELCSKGGNVATLTWCLKDCIEADEFLEVEFKVSDIVAIPWVTDGKFRVKQFKVLREINRKQAIKLLTEAMK